MKRFLVLPIILIALTVAGCRTGVRTASLVDTLPPILNRYDVYTEALPEGQERREAARDSNAVKVVFQENIDGTLPPTFPVFVAPVLRRHDVWVKTDPTINPVARAVFLDSSEALRIVFDIQEPVTP